MPPCNPLECKEQYMVRSWLSCTNVSSCASNVTLTAKLLYPAPIIANSVCVDRSIPVECGSRDWCRLLVENFQFLFRIFVPERESTIWSCGCKRAVDWMEWNRVDCVNRRVASCRCTITVALEREVSSNVDKQANVSIHVQISLVYTMDRKGNSGLTGCPWHQCTE